MDFTLPMEGGCRCGATRIRVSEAPFLTVACHCTGCQRMAASAFSLSVGFSIAALAVTKGEPIIGGIKDPSALHHFCPSCYSWMFTRGPTMEGFVSLRVTMLDDHRWFRPYVETYTSEKLPSFETGAIRSFPKFPEMSMWPTLIAEFGDWIKSAEA